MIKKEIDYHRAESSWILFRDLRSKQSFFEVTLLESLFKDFILKSIYHCLPESIKSPISCLYSLYTMKTELLFCWVDWVAMKLRGVLWWKFVITFWLDLFFGWFELGILDNHLLLWCCFEIALAYDSVKMWLEWVLGEVLTATFFGVIEIRGE